MSKELQQQLAYESRRKSVGIAYLLWFFLGGLGVHRFYTGNTKSAVTQLILTLTGIGFLLIVLPWLLIDLFLIPGLVRDRNVETLNLMGYDVDDQPHDQRPAQLLSKPVQTEADRRREEMLEDLRQTGYRKERRDINPLYR